MGDLVGATAGFGRSRALRQTAAGGLLDVTVCPCGGQQQGLSLGAATGWRAMPSFCWPVEAPSLPEVFRWPLQPDPTVPSSAPTWRDHLGVSPISVVAHCVPPPRAIRNTQAPVSWSRQTRTRGVPCSAHPAREHGSCVHQCSQSPECSRPGSWPPVYPSCRLPQVIDRLRPTGHLSHGNFH